MPRYTLADLFLATTLISIGLGCLSVVLRNDIFFFAGWPGPLLTIVGFSSIFAGAFTPFKRIQLGALVGSIIGWLVFFAYVAWFSMFWFRIL